MKIIIGFSTCSGLLPWLIRTLTQSQVSHTFFLVEDPVFRMPLVWEAGLRGFLPISAKRFWKENKVLFTFALTVSPSSARLIREWLGTHYDYPALGGNLLPIVGRWLKRKWRNPFRGTKALFCSETAARLIKADNFPGTKGLDVDSTLPQDILTLFQTSYGRTPSLTGMMASPSTPEVALLA